MSDTQGWQYQPQRPEDFAGIAGALRSDVRRISDLETRIMPGSVTAGFNQATAAGFGLTPAKAAVAEVEVVKPKMFSRAIVTLSAQGHAMWSVKGSIGDPGYGASWAQLELNGVRYRQIGHVSSGVTKERHWENNVMYMAYPLSTVLRQFDHAELDAGSETLRASVVVWCSDVSDTQAGFGPHPESYFQIMMQALFIR